MLKPLAIVYSMRLDFRKGIGSKQKEFRDTNVILNVVIVLLTQVEKSAPIL